MQRYGGVALLGVGSRNQFRVSVYGITGEPPGVPADPQEMMLLEAAAENATASVGELAEVPGGYRRRRNLIR